MTLLSQSNHSHHPRAEARASLLVVIVIVVSPQRTNLSTNTRRLCERSCRRRPAGGERNNHTCQSPEVAVGKGGVKVTAAPHRGSGRHHYCCYDAWSGVPHWSVAYFEGSGSTSCPSSTDSLFCSVALPSAAPTPSCVSSDPVPNSTDWPSRASARLSQPVRGENSGMQTGTCNKRQNDEE